MSTSESAAPAEQPLASEESPAVEPREPIVRETEREVVLQRSVRFGRILLVGAIIGAVLGVAVSFAYPVAEDAEYTINQVVGFMLFIGAAAGFVAAALLSLILSLVARRNRGTGVAIQADVR
ncbi:hypothetical protein D3248_13475 [Leucobacter zeae]|nr:hypothetical protein [Leucobacter zeae]